MQIIIITIVLSIVSFSAAADWFVDGEKAGTTAVHDSDLWVSIGFPPKLGCHDALLTIHDTKPISSMSMNVDGKDFRTTHETITGLTGSYERYSAITLSSNALSAIKHGTRAVIYTDIGKMGISLKNSADALNRAWQNCENANNRLAAR